jgi:hypothetical protein
MPSIRLGRYEVEEYELPPVCARCGGRAVVSPSKKFAWHPGWVIVMLFISWPIYLILALVLTKRMTVPLPLCEQHRGYWRNRALLVWGGLAVLALLTVLGLILAGVLDDGSGDTLYPPVIIAAVLAFLVWLITAAIVQSVSIRPTEITDRGIRLVGVSEDFIDAVREDRRGADEEDREREEEDRPRHPREDRDRGRVRPRDGEDDKRSRRRTDDEDGGYYDPRRRRRETEDER